jgi:hypothetical protein
MLIQAEKRQRAQGASLWLVGLNPGVLATVQRSPLGKVLSRKTMYFNLEMAVAEFVKAPIDRAA